MNERISIDPAVCHGKPVIKNTRVLVSNVLADLAAGRTSGDILDDYPALVKEDISAADKMFTHR